MIKPCRLSITTTADGKESSLSKNGEIEFSENGTTIGYFDAEAEVRMRFSESGVSIVRSGDYSLELSLKQGEETEGALGISGSKGVLRVFTEKTEYRIKKNSFFAMLEYVLRMSGEDQKMKVRLAAYGENSEEK